ncbi:MAG: penicillin-binding protein 2 [Sphingomonadales bacterium]|nr:penicillin-binding protein 2 [Sphingomonadales bacterium]MBK6492778.1 penicillin-binding protein 2 [Sphingomonadales bacterium]MBK6720351.1 penicillin-binding protein 2 [Sphingomonadales bacterium]MBP7134922.1 penicillin-binding protein 2 [Sphingomonadaceae bacterium]
MTTLVARPQRTRHAGARQTSILVAHQRLMLLMLLFIAGTLVIATRLIWLNFDTGNGRAAVGASGLAARGDIVDRNGEVLARTIEAWSIGVHPNKLLGRAEDLAPKLARLMPERTEAEYLAILKSGKNFAYLRPRAMPELVAAVNALGEPAMAYAREPERLYPQTTLAAHVIGYTDFDGRGVMGMERVLNDPFSDPLTRGKPVALSIDKRVQAAMESELSAAMMDLQAVGATGLVLDVNTGEIIAMVSLPVFNPNRSGEADPEAMRNNVTQSVYELGSTFKMLTMANAIDTGVVTDLGRRVDATAPIEVGRFKISDDHPQRRWLNVPETLAHSSNIATARFADELGAQRTEAFFRKLGFDSAPHVELRERGRPLWPQSWGRLTTMTVAYGHGIAVSPLHLASAYATLVNGGIWRPATLMKVQPGHAPKGRRIISEHTSMIMRKLFRLVVTDGTGKNADVPGFRIGGKTGTAEKPGVGGYSKTKNVSTFAAAFPMDAPRFVVIAMLDSPKGSANSFGQTTAAYTAAPVVAKVIARTGPMLGVFPDASREVDLADMMPLLWKGKEEH